MQSDGAIPTVEFHLTPIRFGERRFDDFKKGFPHGSVVNGLWLKMKHVAACFPLIVK